MLPKNHPRLLNAWSSYDWANSVYNLIVTTAIFPIYYSSATRAAFGGEIVEFFGLTVKNSVLYTYAISFSFLIIVFLSPVLSGIADYSGRKKRFMQLFTYLGSLACIGLYFFDGANIEYGITCAVLASVGYAGSLVFYNGFLPEVATGDIMDRVSAKGFAMGYLGSVVLLIVNLVLILNAESVGFASEGAATKFGFLLVGFWWLGFAQIGFFYLEDRPTGQKIDRSVLGKGFSEIKKVFTFIRTRKVMERYLFSFFFYSMGVQTVMLLAPLFGETEVGMESDEMILVVLVLQILAIAGAYTTAWVSGRWGNRFAISASLVLWVGICIAGYFLTDKIAFYTLAAVLGFVMGGIQSISRSTWSKLIPAETNESASFFSFYDITEKIAIVLGTFSYGFIEQITGSMRNSMIAMSVFFIAGFFVLQTAGLKLGKDR
ncbi:MAG: MFS transporter [Bacteroidia bacterium]|nr:MFS transporter [Bacteroidia bacterium]